MRTLRAFAVGALALVALGGLTGAAKMTGTHPAPRYDDSGRLIFPSGYRQWVFLSSGLDMSYSAKSSTSAPHMFNNVFVQRAAYQAFLRTGTWPDKTVLVLENRRGATNRSILKHGQIQTADLMGVEAHVKDAGRGGWAFYAFGDAHKPAAAISQARPCYACHTAHGAVDTTFVQFYPTLLPWARKFRTLAPAYLAKAARD
ncbi:MAG: cytochrome P460 family protein [Alphaproteobacteria bacterium]|nr:cytochrome P460 family protein [Alphaproteobacteria bacterium]